MSALCRTASGEFRIDNAYSISELQQMRDDDCLHRAVIPTEELFDYDKITLSSKQSERIKNGVFVSHPDIVDGHTYRVYDDKNTFMLLAKCVDGRLRIKKSFRV